MGPQLEDGHTRIAHEILTNTAKLKLNGTQFRIILIVWRYTYGFHRKETDLSVSFFAEALSISKRQIQRELNAMIDIGIIVEKNKPTFNKSRVIAFNKLYSTQVTKKTPHDVLDTAPGDGLDTSTGDGLDTQERYTKDSTKDNSIKCDLDIKIDNDFDYKRIRKLLPCSKTVATAKKKLPLLIKKYTGNQIYRTVERYIKSVEQKRKTQPNLQYMNESTFWNGRFEDYLDANYEEFEEPEQNPDRKVSDF